ncbi:hypothetical protein LOAG_11906 [Loa loa]|uniref:Uncharacterized protein n=1 Tax=Loa loa TaxID=7209 RepID=A0A1S0TM60_LOALO|nr:hypothetical protein LOAG_11906 [Loa loa]EFO16597.2 hypothetical protein LOAG_11906 [Loa loa]
MKFDKGWSTTEANDRTSYTSVGRDRTGRDETRQDKTRRVGTRCDETSRDETGRDGWMRREKSNRGGMVPLKH